MHVTAQSTNLESVPVTNNQQQQSSSALEAHQSNRNNQKKSPTTAVASSFQPQQDGTTNLDDEVSVFYNLCIEAMTRASVCIFD